MHRLALTATTAAALLLAAPAFAEISKDEYKAQVEPICKTNAQASDKYLKVVRGLVKKNKLKQAGENFTKAAAALERAQKQLAVVEQPPSDSVKLTKWVNGIKGQITLMRTIAAKFKAGKKTAATSLVVKLSHNATQTNNLVVPFNFKYCRIDPAKYS